MWTEAMHPGGDWKNHVVFKRGWPKNNVCPQGGGGKISKNASTWFIDGPLGWKAWIVQKIRACQISQKECLPPKVGCTWTKVMCGVCQASHLDLL